jgi:dTMP kinase
VLDGIDKAGKNTQARLLADALLKMGVKVNSVSFPDYSTPLGGEIRRFLKGEVSYRPEVRQLLYVANRWEREGDIRKWLNEKNYVIADRYMQAGLVYGLANGLSLDWMLGMEEGLPKADLVIILDISPETALERERAEDIYEENLSFQKMIRSTYLELGKKLGWKIVDGNQEPSRVAMTALRNVKSVFGLK